MRTLIVGIGALGGVIAARLAAFGSPASLATRTPESAEALRASGLRASGVGGDAEADAGEVAPLDAYDGRRFDLILLATKARDAMDAAPRLAGLLAPGGTLLPIQNGGVPQMLAERLGRDRVLPALSNLGATMHAPGRYEQRNAGHLLIGELDANQAAGDRSERVRAFLARATDVRATPNIRGAVWSKLLLNCSVTTIGAIAGCPMRGYIDLPEGRALFDRVYDESLRVALAAGARPEPMFVDPIPPGWNGQSVPGPAHDAWLARILGAYGDLKPSMLQDFERSRATEIDFINGYTADIGRRHDVPTPMNSEIVGTVHAIERGNLTPDPSLLRAILTHDR